MSDGTSHNLPRFTKEQDWFGFMTHTRMAFEALAGHEVTLAKGKPHRPKIVVIEEELFEREPFEALKDLVEMER